MDGIQGKRKCQGCGIEYNPYHFAEGKMYEITCSIACHEQLVSNLEALFGKKKLVTNARTGKTYIVPTRDIIERGLTANDLDQYPLQ